MARGLPYDARAIEAQWRERWEADGVAEVDVDTVDRDAKFYNLCEFPYPSAEGLHVGHVFRYSGVDVYGRYQRMRGRAVFQPMGWDSFGINAENYALRVGAHPRDLIGRTTERFRAQLSRGGMAWDWRRVIDTSDPTYYRWTQWLFVQLFDAGLAYQAEAPVLWCPSCLTVLAREQTEHDGTRCERCGSDVGERVMRQWFLRITRYADRLLAGLDALDWPERAKRLQRQWIGRSEGLEIDFPVEDRDDHLTVFTTRPDTLYGVTMEESGVSKRVAVRFEDVAENGHILPSAIVRGANASTEAMEGNASAARKHGMMEIEVKVKGPGAGREQAVLQLQNAGLKVTGIEDVTPLPHNGCRPPKKRRV